MLISNWTKFLESLSSRIDWQSFSEEISKELNKTGSYYKDVLSALT